MRILLLPDDVARNDSGSISAPAMIRQLIDGLAERSKMMGTDPQLCQCVAPSARQGSPSHCDRHAIELWDAALV